jgi:hypothetical protein
MKIVGKIWAGIKRKKKHSQMLNGNGIICFENESAHQKRFDFLFFAYLIHSMRKLTQEI